MEVNSLAQPVSTPNYTSFVADTAPAKAEPATTLADGASSAPVKVSSGEREAPVQDVKRASAEFAPPESDQLKEAYQYAESNLLRKAVEQANKKLIGDARMLQCSVHEQTGRIMIKVVDTDTDKIIREIPPEHTLDQFAKVLELAGLMVDKKR